MPDDSYRSLVTHVATQPLTAAQLSLRYGDPVWLTNPNTGERTADVVWNDGPYRERWDMVDGTEIATYVIKLVEHPGSAWLYLVEPRDDAGRAPQGDLQ